LIFFNKNKLPKNNFTPIHGRLIKKIQKTKTIEIIQPFHEQKNMNSNNNNIINPIILYTKFTFSPELISYIEIKIYEPQF